MLRVDLVSLFPELFDSFISSGLISKAITRGHLAITRTNPRDFTTDKHRTVDDTPYGGGSGMVMKAPPLVAALESLDAQSPPPHKIMLTPQGAPFSQAIARRLSSHDAIAFVCGRYEGFDERVRAYVDEELSLGDFVMLGGEVAAMAMVEAVARLRPGVIGNADSVVEESHSEGLLEYPQYTRPIEFRGESVPEILRSGDHGKIAKWRHEQSLARTEARRPDLLSPRDTTPNTSKSEPDS